MTSQPDLRSELHRKLNADRYTGWWPEATLDDNLNAVTLDETGLEHLYINGQRWGWVQRHHAMDIWIGNWRDFDAALYFRVQWRDPYAGDSYGHLFATKEEAKQQIRANVWMWGCV